jgi:integrase
MSSLQETFTILDDEILVYRLEGNRRGNWQMRIKDRTGQRRYIRKSLKTSNKQLATAKAIDLYNQMQVKARLGATAANTKWDAVFERFLPTLKISVWPRIKANNDRYWQPFFKDIDLYDISDADIERYVNYRITFWETNDARSSSRPEHLGTSTSIATLNMDFTYLNSFLKKAFRKNLIRAMPTFPLNWHQHPSIIARPTRDRRGKFDLCDHPQADNCECSIRKLSAEWRKINNFLKGRGEPSNSRWKIKLHRYSLANAYMFTILIHKTAIRPQEAAKLRWGDITLKADGEDSYTQIIVEETVAKTKKYRDVISTDWDATYHRIYGLWRKEYIRFWGREPKADDLLFPSPKDHTSTRTHYLMVKRLFKRAGVHEYQHRDGSTLFRTAYSLRSHCISMLLNRGKLNIWSVSLLAGTSIAVIEKNYAINTSYNNRHNIVINFRNYRDVYRTEVEE